MGTIFGRSVEKVWCCVRADGRRCLKQPPMPSPRPLTNHRLAKRSVAAHCTLPPPHRCADLKSGYDTPSAAVPSCYCKQYFCCVYVFVSQHQVNIAVREFGRTNTYMHVFQSDADGGFGAGAWKVIRWTRNNARRCLRRSRQSYHPPHPHGSSFADA